jgi:hypothetical protein
MGLTAPFPVESPRRGETQDAAHAHDDCPRRAPMWLSGLSGEEELASGQDGLLARDASIGLQIAEGQA